MSPTRSIPMTLGAICLALLLSACGQTGTASAPTEQGATAPVAPPTVAEQASGTSDPGSRTLPFADPIGGITVETDPLRGVPVEATQPIYMDPLEMGPMQPPLEAPASPPAAPVQGTPGPGDGPSSVTTAPPSRGLPLTGSGALPPPVDPNGR